MTKKHSGKDSGEQLLNHQDTFLHPTPMLDELEKGPWPSFVSGLKELAERTRKPMLRGVLDQLEYSYQTRTGYWEGGLVGVQGYGSGVISRRSKIADRFPEAHEFHTLRVQPAPGLHYNTRMLLDLCDTWEEHGSGLIALHGQSGDIMLQGIEEAREPEFRGHGVPETPYSTIAFSVPAFTCRVHGRTAFPFLLPDGHPAQ